MRPVYLALATALALLFVCLPAAALAQAKKGDDVKVPTAYRIQKGDKLSIKFFSHPELNEPELLVRPDGFISPQIVNEMRAEGRTVAELKLELERAYNEILLQPIITVSVVSFITQRVFVGGQINKPGRYEIREAGTLVQAIFLAGGFTRDARRSMVIHARPDGRGDWQIRTADVLKMLDPKGLEKDLDLQDGDFIFVPDSKISQMNKAVEAFRGILPRFF
jgi:polysaccharide biosynthesis/export protein